MQKKHVLPVLCLLTGGLLMTGCSASGETYTAKTYMADASVINELQIDVRDCRIEVALSEDNQIEIDYYDGKKTGFAIDESDSSGHNVSMTAQSQKSWTDYFGAKAPEEYRTITVKVPEDLLASLDLSTTNEPIVLPSLYVSDSISLSDNGGDLSFDTLGAGSSLTLSSKNGDITGTVSGSSEDYTVKCSVKKGSSTLPEEAGSGTKQLTVSANNGDVNISFSGN